MNGFKHKDVWTRRGQDFLIEVSRHEVTVDDGEGRHRWCVYAWIYPSHPRFAKFEGDRMWQDAATELPLHSGPSFLTIHRSSDGQSIVSYQIGADYNHLYDDHFTHYATPEEARTVFRDASGLFDFLTREAAP